MDRKLELAEIEAVLRTQSGRNVIARILDAAGVYNSTFVSDNVNETLRKSIKRDFGLWIEREVKLASPEFYFILLKEMSNATERNGRINDNTESDWHE